MTEVERIRLEDIQLKSGSHKSIQGGACIMEMVSYLANEPWSDHPKCACPILTNYAINLNDNFSHKHRQKLKEFVPFLINTKSTDEVQIARKRLIRWRFVTVTYPMILETRELTKIADRLRLFQNNLESMAQCKDYLVSNQELIYANAEDYAYANADANASAYADAYVYANADANASAYADADAYVYAYAGDYAYADANAYAGDYADADALRESIVVSTLETLRMAIEVGTKP